MYIGEWRKTNAGQSMLHAKNIAKKNLSFYLRLILRLRGSSANHHRDYLQRLRGVAVFSNIQFLTKH